MPGKTIDLAALTILGATGSYMLFLNAGFGIPASAALAFVCMALARYLYQHRPWRERVTTAQARAALDAIARMPTDEAVSALRILTHTEDIVPLLRYPGASLSAGTLFDLWRANMGGEHMTVVCTCGADSDAGFLASTLQSPTVKLIDSAALLRAIRKTGLYIPAKPIPESLPRRLKRAMRRFDRPFSPRATLYGFSLIGMYFVTGRMLCLIAGLAVLGMMGIRVIHHCPLN